MLLKHNDFLCDMMRYHIFVNVRHNLSLCKADEGLKQYSSPDSGSHAFQSLVQIFNNAVVHLTNVRHEVGYIDTAICYLLIHIVIGQYVVDRTKDTRNVAVYVEHAAMVRLVNR